MCLVVRFQKAKAVYESQMCMCNVVPVYLFLADIFQFSIFYVFMFPCDSDSLVFLSPCQLWCEYRRAPARWVSLLKAGPTHASLCHASSPYKCVTSCTHAYYTPCMRKNYFPAPSYSDFYFILHLLMLCKAFITALI